jgi:hypothetical protein
MPLQILYNGKCCQAQKTAELLQQQAIEVGVNSRDDKIDTSWTDVEAHACAPRLSEVGGDAPPEATAAWGSDPHPRLLDVFWQILLDELDHLWRGDGGGPPLAVLRIHPGCNAQDGRMLLVQLLISG